MKNMKESVPHWYCATLPSPVGRLKLFACERAIRAILWPREREGRVVLPVETREAARPTGVLARAIEQLEEYFEGRRTEFDLLLEPMGTPFQQSVWKKLAAIPTGATRSYGELARELGVPGAARAVGAATGRNPISVVVPCHRLVGASGKLTGFAGGLEAKRWLLEHERRYG